MTIVNKETILKVLDDVQNVYIAEGSVASASALASLSSVTELPVIMDSIEVDLGAVDVAYTKTTDGDVIASKFTKGDPSCTMQVGSFDKDANKFFASTVENDKANVTVDGEAVALQGYKNSLVVKVCTIIMTSADKKTMIAFPNAKISANPMPTGGGDANTGYWNVSFVPLANASGAAFYLSDGTTIGE